MEGAPWGTEDCKMVVANYSANSDADTTNSKKQKNTDQSKKLNGSVLTT